MNARVPPNTSMSVAVSIVCVSYALLLEELQVVVLKQVRTSPVASLQFLRWRSILAHDRFARGAQTRFDHFVTVLKRNT